MVFRLFFKKATYTYWIKKNEQYSDKKVVSEINSFIKKPKISIIMPVYNTEREHLTKAINSVLNQLYTNWELCIHDDGSRNSETLDVLRKFQERNDARIKISYGDKNRHISFASNQALALSSGEYIALLDHDDTLSPYALYEVVKVLNTHPRTKFIYSNNDMINDTDERHRPRFKHRWSFGYLLTNMYLFHLNVYIADLIKKMGGFREEYEGAQDFDLALRYLENVTKEEVQHIQKILYHWRFIPQSTSYAISSKPYAIKAGIKALTDYAQRNNITATVHYLESVNHYVFKRHY